LSPNQIPDLRECDPACRECIKLYIKKHKLQKADLKFEIPCRGIKKSYLDDYILSGLENPEDAIAIFDPVVWAKKYLDWICIDPDGKEWQRKTEEGSLPSGFPLWNPKDAKRGKSPFHRPYQGVMLRCSSRRKVSRCGRQLGKTDTLAVSICYDIFTHKSFSVSLITPYQTQVELIFKRIIELISVNPELHNSIKEKRKSPNFYLELYNGSSIHGYTAGTKSNASAGVVRGAHAQKLIFDEADMLSRADLDASLALITNFPEAVVWMSSTPTGKRETFYKACNDTEYKEFHYPSQANPVFSDELERFFRKNLTELGYVHEIEAGFGEDTQGVYQKRYIEFAQADYEYGQLKPAPGWMYSIGVDWNDKVGTVIRIVGLNSGDNALYCVDHKTVKKEGWTQTAAIQEIVNLNRIWHPRWIYVDKGYGHAQIELLHGIGARAQRQGGGPDARLAKIVKGYEFGGSIEIKDLFTKQPSKKPAKPFLVESSVRCFEDGRIRYPKSDKKLTAQLEGYYIIRLTESGVPKYGFLDEAVGDHDVDALNLAIVAFALESGEFGKSTFISTVEIAGQFGETPDETQERKQREYEQKEIQEDTGGRTAYHYKSPLIFQVGLPAFHSTMNDPTKGRVWSWPGFFRDEPPPKRKPGGFLDRLRKQRSNFRPRRTNI
jgi:replicative DNA helicase